MTLTCTLPRAPPNPHPTRSVCGTLINFSADPDHRDELLRLSTPSRLLEVLERVVGGACGSELEVRRGAGRAGVSAGRCACSGMTEGVDRLVRAGGHAVRGVQGAVQHVHG